MKVIYKYPLTWETKQIIKVPEDADFVWRFFGKEID